MKVTVLSPKIAEKIAAGEVVENPASVVKELVENALDAGANRIEVAVEKGGTRSIQVVDNGEGIAPDDLPLIFQRYATSKIARLEDLAAIRSLGFRGEALPSIAAVSRVTLTSRRRGERSGWLIKMEGGKPAGRREVGAPEGTAVLVEDLFYNTPARLKFLKSPPVETGRISSWLWELALAHPQVSLSLHSNNRSLLQTAGDGALPPILGALYGLECARSLLTVDYRGEGEGGSVQIAGVISAPYYHRPTRRGVTVIVNGRVVKAPHLVYTLERGYGNFLPRGRYPVAALRIELPPHLLDVNVHPAKTAVRFQQPKTVSDHLYRAVREVLARRLPLPFLKGVGSRRRSGENETASAKPRQITYDHKLERETDSRVGEIKPRPEREFFVPGREEPPLGRPAPAGVPHGGEGMHLIGQFLHSYLVAQRGEELIVIDQHAAHERVLYHELTAGRPGRPPVQLTLPLEIEIPAPYRERLAGLLSILEELGFKLEPFGDNSYIVRRLPVPVKGESGRVALEELIEDLLAEEPEPGVSLGEQVRRSIACHQAIKANQRLTCREMEELLSRWLATPGYQYCPHGRPSMISMPRSDLDRLFRRIGGS